MLILSTEAAETASDNTAARYESERNKLVSLNENYEEEIQELRNKLSQERCVQLGLILFLVIM